MLDPENARPGESGAAGESCADAPGSILVIDREPLRARALVRLLAAERHRVAIAESAAAAQAALWLPDLEVVLADSRLAEPGSLDLLEWVKRERPDLQVVVVAGRASIESAVRWVRNGAYDFLPESIEEVQRLCSTVVSAIRRTRHLRRTRKLEQGAPDSIDVFERILGPTAARGIARSLAALRRADHSVWVCGESGTGRGALARVLHQHGPRAAGPFVRVVCADWTDSGIEAACRAACDGSLLLDGVEDLSRAAQGVLLRVLRSDCQPASAGTLEGAERTASRLRWVSSSQRSPRALVRTKSLRPELAYRLSEIRLDLPALRTRRQDVLPLAHHFLRVHAGTEAPPPGIEADATEMLLRHDWPGNLCELESAMRGAAALARGQRVSCADLRGVALAAADRGGTAASEETLPLSLAAYEKRALERALSECDGDARAAAARLGIGRSTFYRKLASHGLSARGAPPASRTQTVGTTQTLR